MWFFNSPEIVYGEDALSYLDDLPGKRAFIVTDAVLHEMGFTERIAEHLRTAGLAVAYFAEVEPDPSLDTVLRGAAAMAAFQPDWIVGLGGGSPLDAAKAMWAVYERPDLRPDEITPLFRLGLGTKAHMVAIPTTSGTGSEATWQYVLSLPEEGRKLGFGSREDLPTIAIIDPSLTAKLPARITADTGIDVLSHAVEGYTSSWHNDFTDGLCLRAAQLVFRYLPRAVADGGIGTDMEAREKMAIAATLGGLGWGNSFVGLAHAMGHSLGAVFHRPHGRAVGAFLPCTVEFTAHCDAARYLDLAEALRLTAEDEQSAGLAVAEAIRGLLRRIGQPATVADLGIDAAEYEAALERLCDLAENDPSILPCARLPKRQELATLYRYAYEGKPADF
jgi:alcohol dehydrogenase class IV